jgi:hypothetical protein
MMERWNIGGLKPVSFKAIYFQYVKEIPRRDYGLETIYRTQKACHHNRCDIGFLVYRKLGCPGGPIISNAARSETVQTTPRGGCPKRYPDNDQRKDGAVI